MKRLFFTIAIAILSVSAFAVSKPVPVKNKFTANCIAIAARHLVVPQASTNKFFKIRKTINACSFQSLYFSYLVALAGVSGGYQSTVISHSYTVYSGPDIATTYCYSITYEYTPVGPDPGN